MIMKERKNKTDETNQQQNQRKEESYGTIRKRSQHEWMNEKRMRGCFQSELRAVFRGWNIVGRELRVENSLSDEIEEFRRRVQISKLIGMDEETGTTMQHQLGLVEQIGEGEVGGDAVDLEDVAVVHEVAKALIKELDDGWDVEQLGKLDDGHDGGNVSDLHGPGVEILKDVEEGLGGEHGDEGGVRGAAAQAVDEVGGSGMEDDPVGVDGAIAQLEYKVGQCRAIDERGEIPAHPFLLRGLGLGELQPIKRRVERGVPVATQKQRHAVVLENGAVHREGRRRAHEGVRVRDDAGQGHGLELHDPEVLEKLSAVGAGATIHHHQLLVLVDDARVRPARRRGGIDVPEAPDVGNGGELPQGVQRVVELGAPAKNPQRVVVDDDRVVRDGGRGRGKDGPLARRDIIRPQLVGDRIAGGGGGEATKD